MTALLTTGVTSYAGMTRDKEIVLVENHAEQTVHTKATTVGELLEERGYQISDRLVLQPNADAEISDYMRVNVVVKKDVHVQLRGKEFDTLTEANTVDEFLAEQKFELAEDDKMSVLRSDRITDGMEIVIDSVRTHTTGERKEVDYETREQYTEDLYEGESRVVQEGKEGTVLIQSVHTTRNGSDLPVRTIETVLEEPVHKIVEYGTATRPVVSSDSNESESAGSSSSNYVASEESSGGEWMTFTATAYDPSVGDTTRMGTPARIGVVAVDPSVIPLGSTVVIEGYGTFSAEDTGGAIVGNKIDIFVGSYSEAMDFGVRTVRVKVIH